MAKNKRGTYLIDPRFQLRFSLYLGVFMLLSLSAFSWIVHDQFARLLSLVDPRSVAGFDLAGEKRKVVVMLFIAIVLYSLLAALAGFFFSHRIAGPIYKLKKFLGEVRAGNPAHKLSFRKGDCFPEVADEVNKTLARLEEKGGGDRRGSP